MNIKTKYNVGDKVYYVKAKVTPIALKCPGCDGEGQVDLKDGSKMPCPKCNGAKIVSHLEEGWEVVSRYIRGINVRIRLVGSGSGQLNHYITYQCVQDDQCFSEISYCESDLYMTKLAAEAEATNRRVR